MKMREMSRLTYKSVFFIRQSALLVGIFFCAGLFAQPGPFLNAHAHNDYEHKRPLLDAIQYGFTSVEADVFLINGELYVYHDRPRRPSKERTLEDLYLGPLKERCKNNGGKVYQGLGRPFFLMIDIKSGGGPTYEKIKELLKNYEEILTSSAPGIGPAIYVFISGNRPVDIIIEEEGRYAGLDGRPGDLEKNIPETVMPVVSDNCSRFLSWKGEGVVDPEEEKKLKAFIQQTHNQGKLVRLWAAPDTEEAWEYLISVGVDLINTDRLEEFSRFMSNK